MYANELLAMLDDVKPAGADQWTSRCPNRNHRHARVGIKEVDGKILCRCWGGCDIADVLGAIGLNLSDLFHAELTDDDKEERKQRFSHEQLKHERLIVQIASNSTRPLSMDDKERVKLAKLRLREGGWLTMSDKLIEQDRRRLGWLS